MDSWNEPDSGKRKVLIKLTLEVDYEEYKRLKERDPALVNIELQSGFTEYVRGVLHANAMIADAPYTRID